ncbi:SIR2 family protein [Jannaschia sp.]|nr:SIR2 family protein [Jannaschia sp.]
MDAANLQRTLQSVRSRPETYRLLAPFLLDNLVGPAGDDLLSLAKAAAAPGWSTLLDKIGPRLEAYRTERLGDGLGTRAFVTPSSRFLVTAFLRLLDPKGEIPADEWIRRKLDVPPRTALDSRRSIIAERLDPIAKLVQKLHVNRILTFNYDLEVERYYQDAGYRVLARGEAERNADGRAAEPNRLADLRADGVGTLLRDAAFDPERATELAAFAVGADGADSAVYHFHGRAADGDIVATERDYMNLYLRRSETRPGVDEAVTLTFSARPAFFVGFGMTEDEILRPLRQFISDDDRRAGYRAVVLMTGDKPHAERTAWSAMLYQRYGVHTIWHGGGTIDVDGTSVPIDWLYRVLQLVGVLTEIAKARLAGALSGGGPDTKPTEVEQALADSPAALRTYLDKRIGTLEGVADVEHNKKSALALLCGVLSQEVPSVIEIKPCKFGTHRKAGQSGRHTDAMVDGKKTSGFYLDCLNGLLPMLIDGDEIESASEQVKARALHAAVAMLDGLYGAFMTASMNAALDLIADGHRQWWTDWQQRPEPRRAQFEELEAPKDLKGPTHLPRRYIRHRVINTFTDLSKAESRKAERIPSNHGAKIADWKKKNQTGIRSFDSFIDAIAGYEWAGATLLQDSTRKMPGGRGRRLYVALARRGLGKGTFLSAFATPLGTTAFIQAAWRGQRPTPPYLAAIFVNLSFASEIGSIYDMLKDALFKAVLDAEARDSSPVDRKAAHSVLEEALFDLPRSAALRYLILRLQEGRSGRRVLIAISGAGLLLERDGSFKNGEIAAVLTTVLDEALADAPFDLVLIGDEQPLGAFLAGMVGDGSGEQISQRRGLHLVRLERSDLPDEAKTALRIRAEEIGLANLPSPKEADSAFADVGHFDGSDIDARRILVQFPRSAKPVNLLVDNFPLLAGCLAAQAIASATGALHDRRGDPSHHLKPVIWDDKSGTYESATQDDALKIADKIKEIETRDRETLRTIRHVAARRRQARTDYWAAKTEEELYKLTEKLVTADAEAMAIVSEYLAHAPLPEKVCVGDTEPGSILMAKQLRGEEEILKVTVIERLRLRYLLDRRAPDTTAWREIRRALGANRFSLTLLLAAAQELALTEPTVLSAGERSFDFIYRVLDQVKTSSASRREATVLGEVMTLYERLHVMDRPEANFDFQKRLLRVLAAAGAATSADVLALAPEVQRFFGGPGASFDITVERAVRAGLDALTRRGLVFRLAPHPMLSEGDPVKQDINARYGLHRLVAHQLLRRFGTISSEPVSANSFAPSLYAAMPSGVARLRLSSYQFLSEQMLGLAQYPDLPARSPLGAEAGRMPALAFLDASADTKAQALRAALAMARSSFSIAVVSRFEDYAEALPEPPKLPFFDEYKVRLRWLIRKAWEEDGAERSADALQPLYRDEIVWLYNEVGLASLVQGNLTDAVAHLRQAIYLNQEIEGREGGPLQARISLNLAITQIERGHPAAARTRLQRIVDGVDVEDPIVRHLARGYVGICDHLDGRLPQASYNLHAATDYFRQTKQFRAFAVLSNHHARLIMLTDPVEAAKMLAEAQRAAEAGGHEDVRRHIILSEIRAQLDIAARGSAEDRERLRNDALPRLRTTLAYARLMGLRSLEVDALVQRATLMLDKSEVDPSGRLLVQAMGVAARNEQNLRLSRALSAYARVLLGRGRHGELAHVLPDLVARAKAIGHRTEVFALQKIIAELDANRG